MAKKREWKAWMVVDKNSNPSMDLFGRVASVYRAKRNAKLGCDRGCEIIRVRIVEDK